MSKHLKTIRITWRLLISFETVIYWIRNTICLVSGITIDLKNLSIILVLSLDKLVELLIV